MLNFSELARGLTETMILARLFDGDSYGYRIKRELKALSGDAFEFTEATLYTAFRRLEQEKRIASYWGDEATGTRRRYYHITDTGRTLYAENFQDWQRCRQWIDHMMSTEGADNA